MCPLCQDQRNTGVRNCRHCGYEFEKRQRELRVSRVDPIVAKKCSFCAEEIKAEAVKCKHCGAMINEHPVGKPALSRTKKENWFNSAAKSAVLNGLWLGPANIFLWFQIGRFDEYQFYALGLASGFTDIDEFTISIIVIEMLTMFVSLFLVHSIFKRFDAEDNFFTSVIFIVLGTLLWNIITFSLGITA
jgi:hypothetical protein